MTDPHDLDELASALLDGTTSPEEDALLAGDPALRDQAAARVEELRAVRRVIAEIPPVDAAPREAAITAALAAFDEDAPPAAGGATVTPLAPRRGLSPRAVRALSAAAVVLVLALLVPLLLTNSDRDDEAASFEETGDAIAAGEGSTTLTEQESPQVLSPEGAQGGGDSPAAAADGGVAYRQLGSYEDLDALADAVRTNQGAFDAADGSNEGRSRCPGPTSSSTMVLLAVVDGRAVQVFVEPGPDGSRSMTVVASDTCAVLDEREL